MSAVDETISEFGEYLASEKVSRKTGKRYIRDAKKFLRFLYCEEITPKVLEEYKALQLQTHKRVTVKTEIFGVNKYLEFIGCPYKIDHLDLSLKSEKFEVPVLIPEEYARMMNAVRSTGDDRLYLLVETVCKTGLKLSELNCLTVEAVHAEAVLLPSGRKVYLSRKLCEDLRNYCRNYDILSGKIFMTRNGNLPDRSNVSRSIKNACKGTGIDPDKLSTKALREFYLLNYEKAGGRMADIMDEDLRGCFHGKAV